MELDHVSIWVADPVASLAFFDTVVGLAPLRLDEYRTGTIPFPSVRVSDTTIIDVVPLSFAEKVNSIPGARGTAGHKTNHICLSMTSAELDALRERLERHGTPPGHFTNEGFGARGAARRAFYFRDLDGNVFEARHYD